jgi:hypothetical protein
MNDIKLLVRIVGHDLDEFKTLRMVADQLVDQLATNDLRREVLRKLAALPSYTQNYVPSKVRCLIMSVLYWGFQPITRYHLSHE